MRFTALILIAEIVLAGCGNQPDITKVLTNRRIWGRDFPVVLAQVENWNELGEKRVDLFRDHVVGERVYTKFDEAQGQATRLRALFANGHPELEFPNELFLQWGKDASRTRALEGLVQQQIPQLAKVGNTSRLVNSYFGQQLLAADLTLGVLKDQLGKPEKITREVVRSRFEGRSEVLTTYAYLGGSIQFADSTYSAPAPNGTERLIDRAILDTARIDNAVEQAKAK